MPDRAILLVDHGSKFAAANELLDQVADLVRLRAGDQLVFACHMELAEPSLSRAFDAAVSAGARDITIHPYFLAPGRHSTTDIPRLAAAAAKAHPGIAWRVSAPLGLDGALADLVLRRVEQARSETA